MSLLDLSLVTRTVTTLLVERIPMYSDWAAANALSASGGAPDLVNAPHGLSFYLYHVKEDAHTKSQDWQVSDAVPQRFKPMGLTLYYVMTPKSNLADPHQRAMAEQLMMGLALKTLRDQPVNTGKRDRSLCVCRLTMKWLLLCWSLMSLRLEQGVC